MAPKPKSAYVIKSIAIRNGVSIWSIIKMDTDYHMHDVYELRQEPSGQLSCSCYAGNLFKPCRHKKMLELFTKENAIDTGRMYVYDKEYWINPEPVEE